MRRAMRRAMRGPLHLAGPEDSKQALGQLGLSGRQAQIATLQLRNAVLLQDIARIDCILIFKAASSLRRRRPPHCVFLIF